MGVKKETKAMVSEGAAPNLHERIFSIRGERVILDSDLAEIYGVETKILNKAVARNLKRFPPDFAFRMTAQEFTAMRFQNGTSNEGRGGRRYPPWVFTEHGALMVANIPPHHHPNARSGSAQKSPPQNTGREGQTVKIESSDLKGWVSPLTNRETNVGRPWQRDMAVPPPSLGEDKPPNNSSWNAFA